MEPNGMPTVGELEQELAEVTRRHDQIGIESMQLMIDVEERKKYVRHCQRTAGDTQYAWKILLKSEAELEAIKAEYKVVAARRRALVEALKAETTKQDA